jgi:hypothetical protein
LEILLFQSSPDLPSSVFSGISEIRDLIDSTFTNISKIRGKKQDSIILMKEFNAKFDAMMQGIESRGSKRARDNDSDPAPLAKKSHSDPDEFFSSGKVLSYFKTCPLTCL